MKQVKRVCFIDGIHLTISVPAKFMKLCRNCCAICKKTNTYNLAFYGFVANPYKIK